MGLRFAIEKLTPETYRFLLGLVCVEDGLKVAGPVRTVCFAGAFRAVAALPRFAVLGENAVANRVGYRSDFFGSNFDAKIECVTCVLNRNGITPFAKPSCETNISS
jgi:hypothetical protein